jgi:hypothetical protein
LLKFDFENDGEKIFEKNSDRKKIGHNAAAAPPKEVLERLRPK